MKRNEPIFFQFNPRLTPQPGDYHTISMRKLGSNTPVVKCHMGNHKNTTEPYCAYTIAAVCQDHPNATATITNTMSEQRHITTTLIGNHIIGYLYTSHCETTCLSEHNDKPTLLMNRGRHAGLETLQDLIFYTFNDLPNLLPENSPLANKKIIRTFTPVNDEYVPDIPTPAQPPFFNTKYIHITPQRNTHVTPSPFRPTNHSTPHQNHELPQPEYPDPGTSV
jgi:hypothetical protein